MSRVLVTGGAGFIGCHLIAACLAAGHQVHAIIRPETDDHRLRRFAGRIARHEFDLRDEDELRRRVADIEPELIFHLAARPRRPEDPDFDDAHQVVQEDLLVLIGLIAAAAAAPRPARKLVRTGSLAEYGTAPAPYREDVREAPLTAYGAGLIASTHFCAALGHRLPFPTATARLALTYGPDQSVDYLLPLLIRNCLAGEPTLVRHPADRRDLVHVDDVVDALMRLGSLPLPEVSIVNIASGVAPTMHEMAELILAQTGADPTLVRYGENGASSGAADFRGATALAERTLGWRASTPLTEGMARTVAWYRTTAMETDRRTGSALPMQVAAGKVS